MAAIMELAKIRLTGLVVVTTGVGFLLGTGNRVIDFKAFFATMIGTTLVAISASIFNQIWEVPFDRRMERTRSRPLVTGRIGIRGALVMALASCVSGTGMLIAGVNLLAASLALVTLLSYVLIYTPLKRRATQNN